MRVHFEPWGRAQVAGCAGYEMEVIEGGANLRLRSGRVVRLKFEGASARAAVKGEGLLPGVTHYLVAGDKERTRTGIPNYARAEIEGVYGGIDAVFDAAEGSVEMGFRVAEGVDPAAIRVRVAGGGTARLAAGEIEIRAGQDRVRLKRPAAFQERAGLRVPVAIAWNEVRGGVLSFRVGAHDRALPLLIDPVVEVSTYLGGTGFDQTYAVGMDGAGNPIFGGSAGSPNFPTAGSPARPAGAGGYILRTTPDLKTVLSTTFLAGTQYVGGVAVDAAGSIYAAGSAAAAFTASGGGYQAPSRAGGDAFVVKLDREGKQLAWSAVVGGGGQDQFNRLAVTRAGEVVACGSTTSTNLPTTQGVFQSASKGGSVEGMVARFTAAGGLGWLTYVGGAGRDEMQSVALDSAGNPVVAGLSDSANYPSTPGAFQTVGRSTTNNNFKVILNAVVTKLKGDGSGLVWSTFLSGTGYEMAYGVATDPADAVFVTGASGSKDFPTTAGAFKGTSGGSQAVFITKLMANGSGLIYSTYLGGTGEALDAGYDLTVAADGTAYVAGQIGASVAGQKPLAGGVATAFAAAVSKDGSAIDVNGFASTQSVARGIVLAAGRATGKAAGKAAEEAARGVVGGNVVGNGLLLATGFSTMAAATGERGFGAVFRGKGPAIVDVTLSCDPVAVNLGHTVTMALRITNRGESPTPAGVVTLGFSKTQFTGPSIQASGGSLLGVDPAGVHFQVPALAPGGIFAATVPVEGGPEAGDVDASVALGNLGASSASCKYQVGPAPDVRVSKTATPGGPVGVGGEVEYTIVVENWGTMPASNMTVTDQLPEGLTATSATAYGAPCEIHPGGNGRGGTVVCVPSFNVGFSGGAVGALFIRVKAVVSEQELPVGDELTNVVSARWDGGERSSQVTIRRSPWPIRVDAAALPAGKGIVLFTVDVKNSGSSSLSGHFVRIRTNNLAADYAPPEMCGLGMSESPVPRVESVFGAQSWLRPMLGKALVIPWATITCPLQDLPPEASAGLEFPLRFGDVGVQQVVVDVVDEQGTPVSSGVETGIVDWEEVQVPEDLPSLNCFGGLDDRYRKGTAVALNSGDGSLTAAVAGSVAGQSQSKPAQAGQKTAADPFRMVFSPRMEVIRALPGNADGGVTGPTVLGSRGVFYLPGGLEAYATPIVTFTGGLRNVAFDWFARPGGAAVMGVLQAGNGIADAGSVLLMEFGAHGWQPQVDAEGKARRMGTDPLPLDLKFGAVSGGSVPDAVWANAFSSSISIAAGTAEGQFGTPRKVQVGALPIGVAVGDLAGTGRAQIVVTHWAEPMEVISMDEAGEVSVRKLPGDLAGLSPVVADLDGDGRQDVALAMPLQNRVAILRGNGDGTFGDPILLYAGQRPYFLSAGTVDGKPRLSILTAAGAGKKMVVVDTAAFVSKRQAAMKKAVQ
ncbi:MAG: DUF11 domain-containing protein [Acidobacteria bacterium]|nr:DUF11 domain-containing protein [Acidobacteriota bacterium]